MSLLLPMGVLPFVTPWLFAAGAASVSIPIVIHLLNRRRFRIQAWAAMEFLLAAHRRNVRKLKLQRWLLLLLRCLALLLLAAGIAQFLPPGAVLRDFVEVIVIALVGGLAAAHRREAGSSPVF